MARPRKKPPVAQRSAFRATAERIAEWLQTKEQLIDMIETALLAERERAAKIAESDSIISWAGGSTGDAKGTARRIAATIREGKPQK
jgi:hypothetical protein